MMSKFESIDDFLSNRLSEQDQAAFEKDVASDPSLQADVDLQRQIIEGVRSARRLELKSMLSNVPVGGFWGSGLTATKIIASVASVAVIATVTYFAMPAKTEHKNNAAPVENKITEKPAEVKADAAKEDKTPKLDAAPSAVAVKPEVQRETAKETKKASDVASSQTKAQPKIDVVDPSEDIMDSKEKETSTSAAGHKTSNASRIAVDIDAADKKHNFHYQFSGGKLILYGAFDKSLYEILEINGGEKSVFLFYKGDYYLLNEKQNTITPLQPIRDQTLIRKLKEYRAQ